MYLLVADDLTGACDSGIPFAARGIETIVAFSPASFGKDSLPAVGRGGMLCVNTRTRNLSASEAAGAVGALAGSIARQAAPELVYKKIDSAMRGHPGPETDAIMDAFGIGAAFIAPSSPLQGRTVVGGRLLVNGVPVNETAFGRDPLAPVKSADIATAFGGKTELVGPGDFEHGWEALADKTRALIAGGTRRILFDATEPAHLDLVARAGMALSPHPLFVGSGGLASSLAALVPAIVQTRKTCPSGHVFFICGSAHQTTHMQVAALADAGVPVVRMQAGNATDTQKENMARELCQALQVGSAVLAAPLERLDSPEEAAAVSSALADVAMTTLACADLPSGLALCLTGGETAFDLLSRGGGYMRLLRELSPGVVAAELLDGPWSGMLAVTKAGGFGGTGALVDVNAILADKTRKWEKQ